MRKTFHSKSKGIFVLFLGLSVYGCKGQSANTNPTGLELSLPIQNIKVQQVASNLQAPLAVVFPADGEMLVAEQTGTVRLVKNGVVSPTPFLDIQDKLIKLTPGYDERGLLGLALNPGYKSNGKFYVYYSAPTTDGNNKGVLEEFKTSSNPDIADAASGRVILEVNHPEFNHDGGCLQFGPDGYLYLSIGDGGGGGDKHGDTGNGQNTNVLLGKILRLDVNHGTTYTIPSDNPFANTAGKRPEIWAYGLRNTWRFSFDKASGQLFAGDVGQDTWEEVDIITKGANYGWRITEATHCYNPQSGCDFTGITKPIAEYKHTEGISITGGYVYNGKLAPTLTGKYVFADWSGPLFYLQKKADNSWARGKLKITDGYKDNLKVTSFGEDPAGEVYIITSPDTGPSNKEGAVYRIVN